MSLEKKKRMSVGNGDMYDSNGDIKNIVDLTQNIADGIGSVVVIYSNVLTGDQTINSFGTGKKLTVENRSNVDITATVGTFDIVLSPTKDFTFGFADFTEITVTAGAGNEYQVIIEGSGV
jgi:hypothetical protein